MRLLIQRVKEAKVVVDGAITGEIGPGLLVFLGVHRDDTDEEIPWILKKMLDLRIFVDERGKMNKSVKDINGEILVVSQFTLYGNCRNGRRPDFMESAPAEKAKELYESFIIATKKAHGQCATGRFAAKMEVSLVNDGPVTLIVDSKKST